MPEGKTKTKGKKQRAWEESLAGDRKLEQNALDLAPEETLRLIAFMMLEGQTLREIAERTNLSPNKLFTIRDKEDFRDILQQEANRKGPKCVEKLIQSALPEAIMGLISIATSPGVTAVKLNACNSLLDRGIGKAVNGKPLDTGSDDELPDDPVAAAERLDREIESLNDQLNPLSGH